jgi:hypothetical protein
MIWQYQLGGWFASSNIIKSWIHVNHVKNKTEERIPRQKKWETETGYQVFPLQSHVSSQHHGKGAQPHKHFTQK